MVKVFGIRHHGPGSAKSLKKALVAFQPDCLLIEGPPDADAMIEWVDNPNFKLPVALTIYNPKDFGQASYFPFAVFSPEWQAMKYGVKEEIDVAFMDLPMHFQFNPENKGQLSDEVLFEESTSADQGMKRDPLGLIAKLAGYDDRERWWEAHFEHIISSEEVFESILLLMEELRKDRNHLESKETLVREAFMRNTIRKKIKEGYENIAIVCGAWHAPALHNLSSYTTKSDNAALKGLKKTKTQATWIPWSYERLSTMSGYGAGVISPAWYEHIFKNRKNVVTKWFVRVARLFRAEDLDGSSAHVIEAVRLAETLATLRGLPLPGMEELFEAATSIFCSGYEVQMEVIKKKLIIGDKLGKVPDTIPMIPLQTDLMKRVKTARLSKEFNAGDAPKPRELDLRSPTNLLASQLIYQLAIIGIPWGKRLKGSRFAQGSMKEIWKLHWRPSYFLRIIEAGMWGNNLPDAATNFVRSKANQSSEIADLTSLLEKVLKADLPNAVDILLKSLNDQVALTRDIPPLIDAVPALVRVVKYGDTRGTNTQAVEAVIEGIVPRIFIGLPAASLSLNDAAAEDLFERIHKLSASLGVLNDESYNKGLIAVLETLKDTPLTVPLIKGYCIRYLFDKSVIDEASTANYMSFYLSYGQDPANAAEWLRGFLHGSGLLLIHIPKLWKILDQWVKNLDSTTLKDILPMIRKTFSNFSSPEKTKMLTMAKNGRPPEISKPITFNEKRALEMKPLVQLLLK